MVDLVMELVVIGTQVPSMLEAILRSPLGTTIRMKKPFNWDEPRVA